MSSTNGTTSSMMPDLFSVLLAPSFQLLPPTNTQAEHGMNDEFVFEDDKGNEEDDTLEQAAEALMIDILKAMPPSPDNKQLVPATQGGTNTTTKNKKKRSARPLMYTDGNGEKRRLLPRHSWWYNTYIDNPDLQSEEFHKKFRLRFRLPYLQFLELVESIENDEAFRRWHRGSQTANKEPASPISLLVLSSLRYLGRGWTFDDCAESTAISHDVIRVFFHRFITFGATKLYNKYVRVPSRAEDARDHMHEYTAAGFPGAIGSTDATHIMLERVSHRFRQSHLGFKMCHTARTYNITVNHRKKILSSTQGHPARWNDKTLILFDDFMQDLRNGHALQDVQFELYDYDRQGNTIKVKYQGVWVLVDNGYMSWPTTVPPMKTTNRRSEIRFSAWLESLRKDVECTFGILKGRWRILKTGIRLAGVEAADKIFLTCCALHNWLLEIDGLNDRWENGVGFPSDWQGEIGDLNLDGSADEQDGDIDVALPAAIQRLRHPLARNYEDVSGMGKGDDREPSQPLVYQQQDSDCYYTDLSTTSEEEEENSRQQDHCRVKKVCELDLQFFRSKLIRHFDIAFTRNEIVWPSGMRGRRQPNF